MRILIKNASIITQNKNRDYISKGFVVIKNDKFEEIIEGDPTKKDIAKSNKIVDAKRMILLPGLINAHVHLGESIFIDFFKGKYSLEYYLSVTNELTEKTSLVERGRKIIADYSLLNLIKSGATTICGGRTTDSSENLGIRNVSGYMLMDSFKLKNFSTDIEKKFKEEYKKIKKTKLSYPALFIHSLNTVDLNIIKSVKKILNNYPDTKLILHIAETKKQEQEIKSKFGKSSIKFFYQRGLLDSRAILIHGSWIDGGDMKIVKKCNASIVHCLSSNLKVADKTLNLKTTMKNGVLTCIATDGLVTSGTFSVLDEAAKCFTYHNRNKSRNSIAISFQRILDMITIDAAKVLGLESIIGSIEKGKKADMIFIKKGSMREDAIKNIIKGKWEIYGVMLDGKLKVWNNRALMADERGVVNKFRTLTKKIKEEAQ
jgi:5-methylthioadenosine/S-adenosylhomocysteine deaminase